jgi:D-alanyl-lipoteichoic acid acyltransferase DltB (MBOAT superfamily)
LLFNSLNFLLFFPIVTLLYFLLPHRFRWGMLLAASCLFYMAFIPAYILILIITILIDYFAGIEIEKAQGKKKKRWLVMSILSTCLVLFIFKYFNFFNANLEAMARFLHWNYSLQGLSEILPIGLSFHTFQSLSYVIEVYYGRQKAEHHFGIYALYVMFYPQLVAGPIERPQNLLHQFYEEHSFEYQRVANGLKRMAWGMFKKVVIADRLAVYVSQVYSDPAASHGLQLLLATFFFAYQIYCDFSGYSDIAIGAAQVMGFKLMENFNRPYFSKSISEFWKRWHISLSTWFKDYLYIPLGGNRVKKHRLYINLMVTFLVSGLWHGANWTYVIWGGLNGFYLVMSIQTKAWREKAAQWLHLTQFPTIRKWVQVMTTFTLICISWVFFRATSLSSALLVFKRIFIGLGDGLSLARIGHFGSITHILMAPGVPFVRRDYLLILGTILLLETAHLLQRRGDLKLQLSRKPVWLRWVVYYGLVMGVILLGNYATAPQQFIYFQF